MTVPRRQGLTRPNDEDHVYAAPRSSDPTARDRDEADPVDPDEVHAVRYRLCPEDMEAFIRAHHQRALGGRETVGGMKAVFRLAGLFAILGGGAGAGVVFFLMPPQIRASSYSVFWSIGIGGGFVLLAVGVGVPLALLLLGGLRLLQWMARLSRRRAGRAWANRPEQSLKISRTGVEGVDGAGVRFRSDWGTIPEVVRTDAILLLYVTQRKADRALALLVPRRAFANDEAAAAFGKAALYWSATADRGGSASTVEPRERPLPPGAIFLRYELDKAERRAESRANRSQVSAAWRGVAIFIPLTVVSGVLLASHAPTALQQRGQDLAVIVSIFSLFGVIFFGYWGRRAVRLAVFGPRPDPSTFGPLELTAAPDALRVERDGGQVGETPWSRLLAVRVDDRFVKLTFRSFDETRPAGDVLCVPRRAFASAEAREAFVTEVGRWIAKSAPSDESPRGLSSESLPPAQDLDDAAAVG